MPPVTRLRSLLRNLLRRDQVERDLDSEIDSYLEALINEKVAAGMTPEDARRAALLELGGSEQVKEEVREARAGALLDQLGQDVRCGLRMLRRNPGFTLVAVLTLALGIGANTAIFSVVHAVLLRPLPYPRPERLVMLWQSYPQRGLTFWRLSQANFAAYREQSRSFESLAVYTRAGYNVSGGGEADRLQAANVSAEFFDIFSVAPRLGRTFRAGDDAPGHPRICVLSYGEWQRRFGGDPGVIGRSLSLDNLPTEVVGVMPQGFSFPDPVALWVPLDLSRERTSPFNLLGVARLRPGLAPAGAETETTHILRTLGAGDAAFVGSNTVPPPGADLHTTVTLLQEAITGQSRTPLLILLGSVGLVLLIACANVANMLLARALARAREISLRFALGATASRVFRQLMTECLLLGGLGCAAGLALAAAGLRIVNRLPLGGIPRIREVNLDVAVLTFAVVTGLLATSLFGLAPAWRMNCMGVQEGLRGEGRCTATTGSRRTNGALVALQFALSLILLCGTGLLLRSFQRLVAVEPGFDTGNLLTLRLYLPPARRTGYENPFAPASGEEGVRTARFYLGLAESVRGLPGMRAAALVSNLPFTGDINADGTIVEGHEPPPGEPAALTRIVGSSPGYFHAMGMTLLRGRDFAESDRDVSMPVAIVDDSLARRYWPDGNAVGQRIRFAWDTEEGAWRTIVGVVSAIRDETPAHGVEPHLYIPFLQEPQRSMHLVARTEGDPAAAIHAVRAALREADPRVPAFAVQSMDQAIGASLFQQKFTNVLLALFAVISLLLAAAGIYGVMSLEVTSRLKEIAIRMALGAPPAEVFGLVIRHGGMLAGAGLMAGLAGALAATRLLEGLLFEVTPTDPVTFATVTALLALVALLACVVPARRAVRVDPIAALRQE